MVHAPGLRRSGGRVAGPREREALVRDVDVDDDQGGHVALPLSLADAEGSVERGGPRLPRHVGDLGITHRGDDVHVREPVTRREPGDLAAQVVVPAGGDREHSHGGVGGRGGPRGRRSGRLPVGQAVKERDALMRRNDELKARLEKEQSALADAQKRASEAEARVKALEEQQGRESQSRDEQAAASWAYNYQTKEMVSFDSEEVGRWKGEWIAREGLGGSMFWELSGDKGTPREGMEGGPGKDPQPGRSLVTVVKEAMGPLDQSPNWLTYEGSKWDNIRNGTA